MAACTGRLPMERALRIFSLPVQLMIHPAFTHSTHNLEGYPGHERHGAAVYSKLLKCLVQTQVLLFMVKLSQRANCAVSDTERRKETPISVSILSSNPTPSILSPTRRHPAPFAYWHYWHNHSSCLTTAIERGWVFFSLVMIYYSNEVTEMLAVDFWNR